ncbi:DNA-binding transcriptional MerR regulator [Kribbella orskensis]|uniref:DNA-binding transcriptional MerR regulator n=1 Tax=Kribbella orskensis TaxID=2512216 RepID=A0ABY2BC21_9ACTN|nr:MULTISPECIES: MerR family transcriptional regulator [Kribbella]TCN34802.1 DNA-binding transcriptional MerR regulator [Kribbella sp. VKM Ac-2500]TCO15507.1 DNA-binding transcriptional MerR regulator [Kribbella orskensis]
MAGKSGHEWKGGAAVAWSIAEVARDSGVTSRTLRHYHAIGLLVPARTASNGRRYYEEEQLLRLQQILLLRELGLSLDVVADVLAKQSNASTIQVLGRHKEWLLREQLRLGQLVRTVDSTIENLRKGGEMEPRKVFEGFEHNPYEAEARERWGDEAVDASNERMQGWTEADAENARTGYTRVHEGLATLKAEGADVLDMSVQDLIQLHYEVTCLFWTPTREAYKGLGQMYVDDDRFRRTIGNGDDSLVEFMQAAMNAYADNHLAE